MIKIEMNHEEAIKLAGIMEILEGTGLNGVYRQIIKGIMEEGKGGFDIIDEIGDLAKEEIIMQEVPHLDEDFLYDEAYKLTRL